MASKTRSGPGIASHSFATTSINSIRLNAIWFEPCDGKLSRSACLGGLGLATAPGYLTVERKMEMIYTLNSKIFQVSETKNLFKLFRAG